MRGEEPGVGVEVAQQIVGALEIVAHAARGHHLQEAPGTEEVSGKGISRPLVHQRHAVQRMSRGVHHDQFPIAEVDG